MFPRPCHALHTRASEALTSMSILRTVACRWMMRRRRQNMHSKKSATFQMKACYFRVQFQYTRIVNSAIP